MSAEIVKKFPAEIVQNFSGDCNKFQTRNAYDTSDEEKHVRFGNKYIKPFFLLPLNS